mgnify:CR=1 FL=1
MKFQIFSENEWVYPDSKIEQQNSAELFCARGADVCFQVLTDKILLGGEKLEVVCENLGCDAVAYQLLPACVNENSDAKLGTTLDYDSVKDFVIRQAPFYIYDITYLPENGELKAGRAAFYVRLNVALDAIVGTHSGNLTLKIDNETVNIPVTLKIYQTQVPALAQQQFRMVNWIYYDQVANYHDVALQSDEYFAVLERYLDNELDMRNDVLMIPSGVPVRDENGVVVDFDFTHAEQVGNLALKKGFRTIMGGFIARWKVWDEDEIYLLWDREVGVTSIEGYRQQKLYFRRAQECVERNNWGPNYMQCMVDEPQIPNSLAYRAMGAICRKMMPGVVINDPTESQYIGGGLDIWVVKQAFYEKYLEEHQPLQDLGEEMWVYTCGWPAGKTMNRVMDLPLTASRLPFWMCVKYNFKGFLHWGYHLHTPERAEKTIYPNGKCGHMPAGNSFVVYPGDGKPEYGVRGHLQRTGAYDFELLTMLKEKNPDAALALIEKVCRTFDDYTTSSALIDETRHELLELLG